MGAIGGDELMPWEKMEVAEDGKEEKIVVSVRVRPLNAKEIARNEPCDWECINDTTIMFRNNLQERSLIPTAYTFDRVFRCDSTTKEVYQDGAKEVALSVVSGINSTIFAYGQTSSGKTYTINGITEYTVGDIYEYIKRHEERAFILKFSAIEIYNEAVKDLLCMGSTPLRLLDDPERGTIVEKLTEEKLRDWNHLKDLLSVCEAQRQIGETLLNETSSRSHQILRLSVESSARESLGKDNSSTLVASVNFVDLAGSERASLTLSSGTRLKEGCHINRSLLTLGTVIRKLSKGRNGHVPYRDSKLTRILQPSLGGNARTAIICTICPARSHVEQSRNTLLFASCAKEVSTSARVNVVMSDKALVKHLQKEVARLESELRYPGLAPGAFHLEVLLREKNAQIRKMEEEMKELKQERDLAQSQVDDLLQHVGGQLASRQWEEESQPTTSNVPNALNDILSAPKPQGFAYHGLEIESSNLHRSFGSKNHVNGYIQNPEKQSKRHDPFPRHSASSSIIHQDEEEFSQNILLHSSFGSREFAQYISEDYEDLCKEVQCIEVDEPIRSEDSNFSLIENLQSTENSTVYEDHLLKPEALMDGGVLGTNSTYITLEQHLRNARMIIDNLGKTRSHESSQWSSVRDLSSFKRLTMSRSRSCRENLMSNSSLWLQEAEAQNESTPPCIFPRDFSRKPEVSQRRLFTVNHDRETEVPSREGSEVSEQSTTILYKAEDGNSVSGGGVTSINDFVAELKEMAQVHYQKRLSDGQVDRNVNMGIGAEDTMKNVGLDPVLPPIGSPNWPLEFRKKQQEIIELWHACNVSLIHRTYFFLLFKGDPADSIYMEVELRRLFFLKRNFGKLAVSCQNTTLLESLKNLRRERGMLCREMRRKMSAEERESIYEKWGIALDSKQRRLQLARLLWTEDRDMEHVSESTSIVAKLIGLLKPGEVLKEMFGLSFIAQQPKPRSYSWRPGTSYPIK